MVVLFYTVLTSVNLLNMKYFVLMFAIFAKDGIMSVTLKLKTHKNTNSMDLVALENL